MGANRNKVYIDESNVIRNLREGEQTIEIIEENKRDLIAAAETLKSKGLPILILGDFRKLHVDSGAIRRTAVKNLRENHYEKIAIVGASAMTKTLANLIILASGQSHRVKFFFDVDEALEWLHDTDPYISARLAKKKK